MYIRIKEFIKYIGRVTELDEQYLWFNLNDGKLYNRDDIMDLYKLEVLRQGEMLDKGFIPFLQVDSVPIYYRFLDALNDKDLNNKFKKLSQKDFIFQFTHYIEMDYNSNWQDFRDDELTNYLIEWCNSNNIKYSLK